MWIVCRSVTYLSPTAFPTTTIIVHGTVAPTAAPTAAFTVAPATQYCSCSKCCGCSQVTIPTSTTSIASDAFFYCGGGTELIRVIVTT